jgi:hypothetical protein
MNAMLRSASNAVSLRLAANTLAWRRRSVGGATVPPLKLSGLLLSVDPALSDRDYAGMRLKTQC